MKKLWEILRRMLNAGGEPKPEEARVRCRF